MAYDSDCSNAMYIIAEPIVINEPHPKEGDEKWEGAEQRLNQPAAFALVKNLFPLTPV